MNLVERGYRLLDRGARTAAGTTVRYIRGADVISDSLPAFLDSSAIEQVTEGNTSVVGRQFLWQLHRDELRWENQFTRPKRLDLIEWKYAGVIYVFEVLSDAGQDAQAIDPRSPWIEASVKLMERRLEQ